MDRQPQRQGERALFVARGDVFTVPAKNGPVRNITRTPGAREIDATWSPDGRRIAIGRGKTLKVWDAETGSEVLTLSGHSDWVLSASYSPDGMGIVTASSDGTAKVWDLDPTLLTTAGLEGLIGCVAWSPKGDRVAAGLFSIARTGHGLCRAVRTAARIARRQSGRVAGAAYAPRQSSERQDEPGPRARGRARHPAAAG